MEELSMLWQQISIGGLSIAGVSITGMVGAAVYLIRSMGKIAKDVKGDNYKKELQKDYEKLSKELKDTKEEVAQLVKTNIEKDKKIDLLVDTIAKCEGYSDETK